MIVRTVICAVSSDVKSVIYLLYDKLRVGNS